MRESFERPSAARESKSVEAAKASASELISLAGDLLTGREGSAGYKISLYLRDNEKIDPVQKELLVDVRDQIRRFSAILQPHLRSLLGMSHIDFEDFLEDIAIERLENS